MPNIDDFLGKISQIESAGGKNINHPTINYGLHKGMHAIGQYGLMPLTIQDQARNSNDPEVAALADLPLEDLEKTIIQRPDLEHKIASNLAQQIALKQHGDVNRMAYAWNRGSSLNPAQIPDDKLNLSPYVQKFQRLNTMVEDQTPTSEKVKQIQNSPAMPPYRSKPMAENEPDEATIAQYVQDLTQEPDEDENDDQDAKMQALMQMMS